MRNVSALALAAALAACSDDSNMLTDTERALDNESHSRPPRYGWVIVK